MKDFFKNYKSTLIILLSIIIGALVGIIFKEDTKILSPFGDLFLNMLLIIIVPLIFLTITTSIYKMNNPINNTPNTGYKRIVFIPSILFGK